MLIRPKALRKNATIGIVSPSSPMRDEDKLHKGIRYLESLGYRVRLAPHVGNAHAYLAGSDEERASDIENMFCDPGIDAIFCTRGGYGVMRFLARLNYRRIAAHPKIFVGFSDVTALNCALHRRARLCTFSGAMVGVDMADFDGESEEQFWRMLSSKRKPRAIEQSLQKEVLREGVSDGHLVCGNLSILAALAGTPYAPDYRNAILLMEDIGEESYKVDRLLSQLELSKSLSHSSALLFGQFSAPHLRAGTTAQRPMTDVLREYAERAGKPSLCNIMYGHTAKKLTLPFGLPMRVDARKGLLRFEEAAVV